MANEFIVRKGLVVSGTSQQALRTVGNGNILIGSGSTDNGYTLQVLGGTLLKGTGTTTGSTFVVLNSSNIRSFTIRENGNVLVGSGTTDLGSTLSVIGSSLMSGNTSGSTLLNVVGSQGQLFSVVDTLTGSLMSVNDITGLPILEVFSDDRVVMGEYATNALVVSGRSTGFGVTPSDPNYRIISSGSTLFSGGTMVVKGSGTTSGSTVFAVQNSTGGTLLNLFNNGNLNIDSGVLYVDGDNGWVGVGTTIPTQKLHVNSGNAFINGTIYFGNGSHYLTTDNASYAMLSSNRTLQMATSGNPVLSVFTTQNVAIGTTTDAGYKLDVNGTARLNSTTLIEGPLTVNYGNVVGGTSIVANGNTIHNGGRGIYATGYAYGIQANQTMVGNWSSQPNAAGVHGTGQIGVFGSGDIAGFSGPSAFFTVLNGDNRVSARSHISTFQIRGSGSTELTNTLLLENSSGIKTFTVNDNGNVLIGLSGSTGQKLQVSGTSLFTGTFTSLTGGSSQVLYNMDLSQSAITGNTIYAVNISPTLRNTASGQTQVALRVMPTFTGSSTGTSTTNKIVDFGSANVGTQFTVTDATTGDIYMVNDVSGLPIIAANSSWDVSMYNYPNTVFKKTNNSLLLGVQNNTGSTISVYGDLVINEGYGFTNTTTQVSGTTSTGTTSATTIYTLTTSSNKSYSITCLTTGYGNTTRRTTSGKVDAAFKNSGGTVTMIGTTIQYIFADIPSTNVDFEVSGTSIVLRVTGTTTENYTWGSTITSQVI